jgi:hypothetical protein
MDSEVVRECNLALAELKNHDFSSSALVNTWIQGWRENQIER